MLRITEQAASDGALVLVLEGTVAGPWVDELLRCASAWRDRHGPLGLDLSGVQYIDAAGESALRALLEIAELRGSSLYASGLLEKA